MTGLASLLVRLVRRALCRHKWRYSRPHSRRTATEICRRCNASRRMPQYVNSRGWRA